MATKEGLVGDDGSFPAVDVNRELNLGEPQQFPVDPVSSDVSTAKKLKENADAKARAEAADKKCKCNIGSTIMSVLVVSGVVVAAVGVALFVSKKLKQT